MFTLRVVTTSYKQLLNTVWCAWEVAIGSYKHSPDINRVKAIYIFFRIYRHKHLILVDVFRKG